MRVTREKAEENREKIVQAAARLFQEKGFDGVGVDAIMQAAGLTHGGFYNHFRSKDALAEEAVGRGFAEGEQKVSAHQSLQSWAATYLSPGHRDDRSGGCTLGALVGDIARQQTPGVRQKLTSYVRTLIARFGAVWPGRRTAAQRREHGIESLCTLVGALVLARAVDDPTLSDEILAVSRARLDCSENGKREPPTPRSQ